MTGLGWLMAHPVAHRGFHDKAAGRIENTLAAAEAAIARGFAIECDVQRTADDNVVVFHDNTLDRVTDAHGPLDTKTLAEIKSARIRGSTDTIPTLAELLGTVAGKVPLVIEFKSNWKGDRRLEQQAAKLLSAYAGPVAVMSFDPASMRAMAALAPSLPRGLVADRFVAFAWPGLSAARRFCLRHLFHAVPAGARFIAYGVHALPANAPLLFRHLGFPLLTWTVRSQADRAVARRYADQMIFEGFDPAAIPPRMASAESA